MNTLSAQNTLITATGNNRETLLETFNKEVEALKLLSEPIFSAVQEYEANDQEQQLITARIAEIDKALLTITEKVQGVKLTRERRELQDELAFMQIIHKNRRPEFIKELTALAIPYYKQEPTAFEALKALYAEVYDTATPQTVGEDYKTMVALRLEKVGTGNLVQHALKAYNVLELGNKAVQDEDGNRVIIGNNAKIDLIALETLNKAVEALTKDLTYRGGLYR
ncbi:hypothetical protein PH235_10550 [Trichococcus sp. K1Tr]|uniref:hypothetical protein n=1 Tax=Trichococcus sp. K1Tr TaxID=3020847 RepID=UPI00232D2E06|nr:hypothetical protein [Trichococcus sp. K1Tr]MDB6353998.1 hypothetical protein [Trichococcus sp. K1Tr]